MHISRGHGVPQAPSESAPPSPSRRPVWAVSVTPSPTPSPSTIPYAEQPLNLLWIIIMSVFLCLVMSCTVYWGRELRSRIRAGARVKPELVRQLKSLPTNQIASSELQPSEYEVERQRRASVAREGGLVSAPRRMSMTTEGAEALAAAEASRAARKERRASQLAAAAAAEADAAAGGDPTGNGSGDSDNSDSRNGPNAKGQRRRSSVAGGPGRRGSVNGASGRGHAAVEASTGQRRRSLVSSDRHYDTGGPAAATGYRFNYAGHQAAVDAAAAMGTQIGVEVKAAARRSIVVEE